MTAASVLQRSRLAEVVSSFLDGRGGVGGSLMADGRLLYSYSTVIGRWEGEAVRLPNSRRFYSRTTGRHRNMLRDMAKSRGINVIDG